MILANLRKDHNLNGEVGFIVFKPDDPFDGRYRVLLRDHPDIVEVKGLNLRVDTCAPCAARRFTRAPLHPRARRSISLRSAPRAGPSTTTRSSRSSTASRRSSD